ncbi:MULTISPECIES: L,D-transpeptidase [unclassified Kaistella]|uniref:L,D-transpeptidase n=1 Tax=unclassified Kaistella TaxID=2762626 RepID=UPI002733D6E8|nr:MULTISPECIES: L,D-transpeptidase [unclassified Kaistella]MDP2453197.1 L,D-transpeptidase [Kaistella sp. SH11-4b]MDP2456254.1 L,D-transpeptidase [Kaistella sp. SH40-3]MDP2459010.1 L,D-transpeptidase [Kaistella sp. SH19-2b]
MLTFSQKKLFNLSALVLMISFAVRCEKGQSRVQELQTKKNDSLAIAKKDSLIQDSIKKNTIVYQSFIFPKNKKDSAMAAFNKEFSKEDQYVILALNRLDLKNKWRADTLMIPDKIDATLMSYSPFPRNLDRLKDVKKIVFFSYPIQAYALYDHGNLVKWGPTSMGSKTAQTKRGLMFANWKKELAISTVSSEWKLPYNFNIHNTLGIGWHQYDLPGYPASHSCLRLLMDDAKFLYAWADQWILNKGGATVKANGTPVIVFGDYKWGAKKPWKNLSTDSKSDHISVEEMNAIIEPDLSKILEEQAKRDEVLATLDKSQPFT